MTSVFNSSSGVILISSPVYRLSMGDCGLWFLWTQWAAYKTTDTPTFLCFWLQGAGTNSIRLTMESALTARDRVGVQDFVLLENFTSEAAFIENLRKRFKENLIYVSSKVTDAKVFISDLNLSVCCKRHTIALLCSWIWRWWYQL